MNRDCVAPADSLINSNFGAAVGTFVAPGAETQLGGFVGGMVASILSREFHFNLQQSVHEHELANAELRVRRRFVPA